MMMKRLIALAAIAASVCGFAAEGEAAKKQRPATEGATMGAWTMDMDAAVALARKEEKPLFLCFTGSDWCGWCQLMEENVFSKPEWLEYAKDHVVLVWLDFPRDESLVPEHLVPQNERLRDRFQVRGYPLYIIVEPGDGKIVGKLSASRDYDVEGFVKELDDMLILRDLDKLLSAEEYAAYQSIQEERQAFERELEAWHEVLAEEKRKQRAQGEIFELRHKDLVARQSVYTKRALERARNGK